MRHPAAHNSQNDWHRALSHARICKHGGVVRRIDRFLVLFGAAAFVVGCSSGNSSQSQAVRLSLPRAGTSTASLKATAEAWARAFLVGSPDDIRALQGPECANNTGTTQPQRIVSAFLSTERALIAKHVGRPVDRIKIEDVLVRNVTASQGDALVEYDLPANVVGNDNWVTYAVHGGRWLVADCHAPIGGESSSKSASASTAP